MARTVGLIEEPKNIKETIEEPIKEEIKEELKVEERLPVNQTGEEITNIEEPLIEEPIVEKKGKK